MPSKLHCVFFVLAVLGLDNGVGAAPFPSPIPLENGIRWTYQGKIEWTLPVTATVKSTNIVWTTEVVDSVRGSNAQAAVIRGFPDELAWYELGKSPRFQVFYRTNNCVYQLGATNEDEARMLAKGLIDGTSSLKGEIPLLDLPLLEGKHWGGDPEREDNYYRWNIEDEKTQTLQIKGLPRKQTKVYSVAYRSLPDHQILEIAPGVGLTRYVFVHHGTVATADVRLISIKLPP